MYNVYVLKSKKLNKHYIGYTNDLVRRLWEHNNQKSKFTSYSNDWELIYFETFEEKIKAIGREKFFKSGKGREFLKTIQMER